MLTSIRRDAENPWTGDGADVLAEHMTAILASVPATHSLSIVIAQAMQSFVADEEAKVKARAQAHSAPLATSLMSASNELSAIAGEVKLLPGASAPGTALRVQGLSGRSSDEALAKC